MESTTNDEILDDEQLTEFFKCKGTDALISALNQINSSIYSEKTTVFDLNNIYGSLDSETFFDSIIELAVQTGFALMNQVTVVGNHTEYLTLEQVGDYLNFYIKTLVDFSLIYTTTILDLDYTDITILSENQNALIIEERKVLNFRFYDGSTVPGRLYPAVTFFLLKGQNFSDTVYMHLVLHLADPQKVKERLQILGYIAKKQVLKLV